MEPLSQIRVAVRMRPPLKIDQSNINPLIELNDKENIVM